METFYHVRLRITQCKKSDITCGHFSSLKWVLYMHEQYKLDFSSNNFCDLLWTNWKFRGHGGSCHRNQIISCSIMAVFRGVGYSRNKNKRQKANPWVRCSSLPLVEWLFWNQWHCCIQLKHQADCSMTISMLLHEGPLFRFKNCTTLLFRREHGILYYSKACTLNDILNPEPASHNNRQAHSKWDASCLLSLISCKEAVNLPLHSYRNWEENERGAKICPHHERWHLSACAASSGFKIFSKVTGLCGIYFGVNVTKLWLIMESAIRMHTYPEVTY